MQANLEERNVRLLVFAEDGISGSISVAFSANATIKELISQLASWLLLTGRPGHYVLVDPRSRAQFRNGALLRNCQLLHGQIVALLPRSEATERLMPELGDGDLFRIVVEIGPQIGMAWPLSAEKPLLHINVDDDGIVLGQHGNEPADVQLSCSVDSPDVLIGTALTDEKVRLDGVPLLNGCHVATRDRTTPSRLPPEA